MALRFMDGFDHYVWPGITQNSMQSEIIKVWNAAQIDGYWKVPSGRYSGLALQLVEAGKSDTYVTKIIPSTNVSGWYAGFNIRNSGTSSAVSGIGGAFGVVHNGSTIVNSGEKYFNTGFSVSKTGHKCRLNGADMGAMPTGSGWNHVEFYVPSGTGTSQLWINGVSAGTTTNPFNYNTGWTLRSTAGTSSSWIIDDFYILDTSGSRNNSRLGSTGYPPFIETLWPTTTNATTFSSTTVPSTGTSFGMEGTITAANSDQGMQVNQYYVKDISNNATVAHSGTRSMEFQCGGGSLGLMRFSADAISFSFWYRRTSGALTNTLRVKVNDVNTDLTVNSNSWTQTTITPSSLPAFVEMTLTNSTGCPVSVDNWSFNYSGSEYAQATSARSVFGVPYTPFATASASGQYLDVNLSNLSLIQSPKAVYVNTITNVPSTSVTIRQRIDGVVAGSGKTESVTSFNSSLMHPNIFETHPLAGAVWTTANINSMTAGLSRSPLATG